ncbi:MAG: glutamate--tRNA ligase, partial [Alphaproteobacteria bacterium]|nr:glutamate--tRNA ligase [Alphaproteobacteria bacterium]
AKLLHRMDFAAARPHLPPQVDETFWRSVRGNIGSLEEAGEWWDILHRHRQPVFSGEDAGFLSAAAKMLPPEPWDGTTYDAWIAAVKSATGRKGKELFMPLRRALTGKDRGPELKALLPLLGRKETMGRLTGSGNG